MNGIDRIDNSDWPTRSRIEKKNTEKTPLFSGNNHTIQQSTELTDLTVNLWTCQGIRQYVLVEVVVFLYFLSIVTSASITQYFLFDKIAKKHPDLNISGMHPCEDFHLKPIRNSSSVNTELSIQKETANVIVYLNCASYFPAILPTLFMGGLSDRYGRKVVLLIALCGSVTRAVIYVIVVNLQLNINFFFIGNVIEGLTGSYGTCLATMFSLIADITVPGKNRSIRITVVESMLAISSAIGLLIAGFWVPYAGFAIPMMFCSILLGMAFIFTLFCIPETLKPTNRAPFNLATLKRCAELYTKDTENHRRWKLLVCITAFFIIISVGLSELSITTVYLLNEPFCWQQTKINLYSAVRVLLSWICILGFLKCFAHRMSENMPGILGCVSNLASLILWGVATRDIYIYASGVVGLIGDVTSPVLRSVMSHQASKDEQGILFASVGVIELFCTAVMGVVVTIAYNLTLEWYSGFVFLCLAVLVGIVLVMLIILNEGIKRHRGSTVVGTVEIE